MDKELEIIIKKMCSIANVSYEQIDFENDNFWYDRYWWTEKDQEKFRSWLINRLKTIKKARELLMNYPNRRTDDIKKVVDMFILTYGFTTNKEKVIRGCTK